MRALVITHGRLGEELLASARELHAVEAPIEFLSNRDFTLVELIERIAAWLAVDSEPALILVDVGAGSCGVAAQQAALGRQRTWVLGGLNLPMILAYLSNNDSMQAEDLVAKILNRAVSSVDRLGGS